MKNKVSTLILALVASMLVAGSCDKHEEDRAALWTELGILQTRVDEINQSIVSLKAIITAIQEEDYITDVKPVYEESVKVGYVIYFLHGNPITIYDGKDGKNGKNGKDGEDGEDGKDAGGPDVSIKKAEDGQWYWTVNGQWIVDDWNNKFPVYGSDAICPQLKISNGAWYVSYDDGRTWTFLSNIVGTADACISYVSNYSEFYRFRINDGSYFDIPVYSKPSISFDVEKSFVLSPGKSRIIKYNVVCPNTSFEIGANANGGLEVYISRDGNYSGSITVVAPENFESGQVTVFFNSSSYVIMNTFNISAK